MTHEFQTPESKTRPIVYVRPVDVADLPEDVRAQAGDLTRIYAIGDEEGKQLALVADRRMAFDVARQNDMVPVSVH